MRARLAVLATVLRSGRLRAIAAGHLLFAISEAATWIAILVYANDRGGPSEVGVVAVVQLLPPGVLAPFSGVLADRWGRQRVLTLGYVAQLVFLVATAFALGSGAGRLLVYAVAALASGAMAVTRPSIWSLLPWVVSRPAELTAANVAGGFAESLGLLLGPLAAGIVLSLGSVTAVFAGSAGLVAVAGLLAWRLDVPEPARRREASGRGDDRRRESSLRARVPKLGIAAVLRSHTGVVIAALTAGFVVLGAVDVAAVLVAAEVDGGEGMAGYLSAASGAGAVLGAATTVLLVGRRHLLRPLAVGAVVVGAAVALMGGTTVAALAALLFVVNGVGAVVVDISGRTLIQRSTAEDVLAAVFGLLEGLTMLFMAVGALGVSLLADAVGTGTALVVAGLVLPTVVAIGWPWLHRLDEAAEPPDHDLVELVLGVEFLAPLPSPVVEQLALNLVPRELTVGEVVIEEGTPGDHFYLVEDGLLVVERNGSHVAQVGPGGFVGEIALLDGVARTATVTAAAPSRVRQVDREVFVEAVTGHPQSLREATAVAAARRAGQVEGRGGPED